MEQRDQNKKREASNEMALNSPDVQIPNREHMISAKAATLILRGIIAAGEPPNMKTERIDTHQVTPRSGQQQQSKPDLATTARSGQQNRPNLANPAGVPDAKARATMATEAKSTRPRRKAKSEDEVYIAPVKKSRKE